MNYELCEKCKMYEFSLSKGILCGITHEKPSFENNCEKFILDSKKEESLSNTWNKNTVVNSKTKINNNKKDAKTTVFLAITISTIIWGIILLIIANISLSNAVKPIPIIIMASTICLGLWAKTSSFLINVLKE